MTTETLRNPVLRASSLVHAQGGPQRLDQARRGHVYTVRQVQIPADRAADFRKLQNTILMDERGTAVLKKQ